MGPMVQLQAVTPDWIVSHDPSNGQRIGEVEATPAGEISSFLMKSRAAQARWAELPVAERVRYLRRVCDYIIEHIDDLSHLISRESGKARMEALSSDVFPVIYLIDYF